MSHQSADRAVDTLSDSLRLRLILGSHLAQYLRQRLATEKGYTCTVGVSTNKLLSKLVGNLHKPNNQTTLLPPYTSDDGTTNNVTSFMDDHEVGKIPGIGFKIAQKVRAYVLRRPAAFDDGLVYGGTKEEVLVGDVRMHSNIGPEALEKILGGAGAPHGIGAKIFGLLNGIDNSEVGQARDVPTQISLEDSYVRLDTIPQVIKELDSLSKSLLKRMHTDLLEDDEEVRNSGSAGFDTTDTSNLGTKRWMAYPKTLRLTTRPRPPQNPDGSRNRSFARISRSGPMPNFVFNLKESIDVLAERLVADALLPLFRKLHPEKNGWNLSLINIAATNMVDAASEKGGVGRDIGKMFKQQETVLRDFKVVEPDTDHWILPTETQPRKDAQDAACARHVCGTEEFKFENIKGGSEDFPTPSQEATFATRDQWQDEDRDADGDEDLVDDYTYWCEDCGATMPPFAMGAHIRWHAQG